MKLLTIVIPSYNTEEFIEKNMKTFLDERLYKNVEVLIINDGSSDKTAELAAAYEEKYREYIRLINKENGGHGSVINRGIKEAQGKYFKVVDADDWVNTENLVKLVSDLRRLDVDVVINDYTMVNQQSEKRKIVNYQALQTESERPFAELIKNNIYFSLHAVTFRTTILQEKNIKVTEKCFYEDYQYVLFPCPYIKTYIYYKYAVYYYLVGQKAQSVNAGKALNNVEMAYKVFNDMVDYYEKNKKEYNTELDEYMKNGICIFLRSLYNIYLRNRETENITNMMLDMDTKVKLCSNEFYNLVAEKNKYIRLLRKGNRETFFILAIFMELYKWFHVN